MTEAPSSRQQQQRPQSVACATCPDPAVEKRKIKIRVSLFFDGTGNNRVNTAATAAGTQPWFVRNGPDAVTGSYGNDSTNVVRLDEVYDDGTHPGYDHAIKIYVEGIGTVDLGLDRLNGLGLGQGSTGIMTRVGKGLRDAVNQIVRRAGDPETTEIIHVHLDSFGFSRGAAAARHFIHRAVVAGRETILSQVRARGFVCGEVRMRYCGLFDCVSSHGGNHLDDVAELNLRAVAHAEKTVHLCAAEEHRENFRLTNIASAGGKGLTIYLPGVHSDIGGSYNDNQTEDLLIYKPGIGITTHATQEAATARERNWLIAQGWYLPGEITMVRNRHEVVARRTVPHKEYSFIPMQLQARYARQSGIVFLRALTSRYGVPGPLVPYQRMIERDMATTPTRYFSGTPAAQEMKILRHRYLHFSAAYGDLSSAPRWTGDNRLTGRRWRGDPIAG